MNWLIADDEADIRNLVAMICQVWGHTPMTFESGQKADEWLDTLRNGTNTGPIPDFALMDIRMPGKRGDDLAKEMRQIPELQDIPIVLMTAFVLSDEETQRMRNEFGVDAVIHKPLPDFDKLRTKLHDIIEAKKKSVESQ